MFLNLIVENSGERERRKKNENKRMNNFAKTLTRDSAF